MFILSFTGLGCTVNPWLNSFSSMETAPDKFILSIKKSLPPPLTNLNLNLKLLELDNPKNWVGFVMVQFTIDEQGNVLETKVLYPHSKTTITLTSMDQKFIANDCKMKFKFTPTSSGITKDRLVKRIQYIEK